MKIALNAHLLSNQHGYRVAGIHGYIYHLLRHLPGAAPPDWAFTVFVGKGNQTPLDGMTIQHASIDTGSPLRRIAWEQIMQPWQLRGFDLYHALAFVSPLLPAPPSVVTVYDLSFVHYPHVLSPARRLYLRLLTALSCQRARRITAISQSTADDLHHTLGIDRAKIDVALCGYDTERFHPLPAAEVAAFKQRHGLPARFWLFVGTLEPRKNLPTLLRAYAALPPSERLPLVLGGGKGWQYDDIFATIAEYQLQNEVLLPGYLSAESLPLWYNSADVLVYPSVYEGFGLPVLEAMACGVPVIASDASSFPEVVGEAGMLISPHDEAAWTAALHRASVDAAWRETAGQQGMARARQFTWQRTAEATVDSYRQSL